MKPVLRGVHSPDLSDLATFEPPRLAFAILLQLLVGPDDGPGEESFDLVLCSPEWLRERAVPVIGRHHLIVQRYDYEQVIELISGYLEECAGADWQEVAARVGRLGRWEFEDYANSRAS